MQGFNNGIPKDVPDETSISISHETGVMYNMIGKPIECMLIMLEDYLDEWVYLSFNVIEGFHMNETMKTIILANHPMDISNRTYSLKHNILQDKLVPNLEVPIEEEIHSKDDIVYQKLYHFAKYAIKNKLQLMVTVTYSIQMESLYLLMDWH